MLNLAENADLLTKQQQGFNKHTKKRDVAMLSLMLGTGIRVSECVGINNEDINSGIRMTFSGDETREDLDYLCRNLKHCVETLRNFN